jgi:hypothetical protein
MMHHRSLKPVQQNLITRAGLCPVKRCTTVMRGLYNWCSAVLLLQHMAQHDAAATASGAAVESMVHAAPYLSLSKQSAVM